MLEFPWLEIKLDSEVNECVFEVFDDEINNKGKFILFDSNAKILPMKRDINNNLIQTFNPNNPPCYLLVLNNNEEDIIFFCSVEKVYYLSEKIKTKLIKKENLEDAEKIVEEFLENGTRKRELSLGKKVTFENIIQSYINEFLI